MHISTSSLLGVLFLGLSLAATFTMFHYWGYPYDKEARKSACPQWKMNIHRAIGFAYIAVYVALMSEMIPRLWEYQVEFPARTVAHILLGAFVGCILLLKVTILRFFRHFEEWMPILGTSLMVSSVLLAVMSLPAFIREQSLAEDVYSDANRTRVASLLPEAGYPDTVDIASLSSRESLEQGRRVLLDKCVDCHDLKTVIAKPRTPSDWVRTCSRMVEKPSLAGVITEAEGHLAAAYLIAITPDLQRSAKRKREDELGQSEAQEAVDAVLSEGETQEGETVESAPAHVGMDAGVEAAPEADAGPGVETSENSERREPPKPKYDLAKAKDVYDDECSQCHPASDTDDDPPKSIAMVNSLLSRMVDNGLDLEKKELAMIRFYLIETYVKKK